MDILTLNNILTEIQKVHAGIIGDFCIDIYWQADMTKSELSKETPNFPIPVIKETCSPGAAGNVAANMTALKPASLSCIGLKGNDWRGDILQKALEEYTINAQLITAENRFTNAYIKPMKKGYSDTVYEGERLDFENFSDIDKDTEDLIISRLENISSSLDVLAVSDQFKHGVITENIRYKLSQMAENGLKIIADSRYNINYFKNMFLKPNESECAKSVGSPVNSSYENNAKELAKRSGSTVIETLGEKGAIITDGSYLKFIPAVKIKGRTDICGAGDTFLSALTLAIGAGFNLMRCTEFAALCSAVTVQKIGQTGTASPEEIKKLYSEQPD